MRGFGVVGRVTLVMGVVLGASVVTAIAGQVQANAPVTTSPVVREDNPTIADSCGIDVVLVLDASGSIQSSNAVDDVRNAGEAFLDALADTGSYARVLQFGSISEQLAPRTEVTAARLQDGEVFGEAIQGYYNPKPSIPPGVSLHEYRSGDPQQSGSWRSSTSNQYTNWDQSLDQANDPDPVVGPAELILYVTDGDPTAYDFNQAGDPFDAGPPPDVGIKTDANSTVRQITIDRAVAEANEAKGVGTRMLAVGVGAAVTGSSASRDRLTQIAGPLAVSDGSVPGVPDIDTVDSINEVDVALVRDFDKLASFLRGVVSELCSPSLSIRKLAQTPDDADFTPQEDWDITVAPTVTPPGTFDWVLPDTDPVALARCSAPVNPAVDDQLPRTCPTNDTGIAVFQWEPDPSDAATSAVVTEEDPGGDVILGRPDGDDWTCRLKNIDGTESTIGGDFGEGGAPPNGFQLDVESQQIITCSVYNSFDYDAQLVLAKVDDPQVLRGDLTPPATTTSTFTVTNPGNSPVGNVAVFDDECGKATYVSGDANNDGALDNDPTPGDPYTGETWIFTCDRDITAPAGSISNPAGYQVTNTAIARGTDPAGTLVESNEAVDTIAAFIPAIELTKLVAAPAAAPTPVPPAESIAVPIGTDVVYTYAVTNTGNTPLGTVTLADDDDADDTTVYACALPTFVAESGTVNGILDVGETWSYSCAVPDIQASVVNVADVTAVPLQPGTGTPFVDPNPIVEATDFASVEVSNTDIVLTKSVTPTAVLLDEAGDPEPVTYTFTATVPNVQDAERVRRPSGNPRDPGWVVDTRCGLTGVQFVSVTPSASNPLAVDDDFIDPGEIWNFQCLGLAVSDPVTVNVAAIVGQPIATDGTDVGTPVFDVAFAIVEADYPGIAITKVALRDPVVDADAVNSPAVDPNDPTTFDGSMIAGADYPVPRLAQYSYDVVNTGTVPLDLGAGPVDDKCSPLTLVAGSDANTNGLLDTDEVWEYTCETALDRVTDSNVFPVNGAESGLAENTVIVTGIPFFQGANVPAKAVQATDTAQVLVIEPGISLTKTASADIVRVGTEVTYTFAVANTGDVGLDVLGPFDDKCSPLVFDASTDTNGNGLLDGANSAAAETWIFTCARVLDDPIVDVNEAVVEGLDPLGNVYADHDTASVTVVDPAIDLVKTVDETLVPPGTPVNYTFVVTNVGQSPDLTDDALDTVTLSDAAQPEQPTCTVPAGPQFGPNDNNDDLLERLADDNNVATVDSEQWTYTCAAVISETTLNVAGVIGFAQPTPDLRIPVADFDAQLVTVFNPAIDIIKTANPTSVFESGDVTYTYEVRNPGDVPLSDVTSRISDDKCAPVTYVSGDEDGDGLLDTPTSIFEDAADEVWIFTCTTRITTDTTNVVTVTGTPTDTGGEPLCGNVPAGLAAALIEPCDVTDTATADVIVLRRGSITIVKDADPNGPTPFQFAGTLGPFQLVDDGGSTNTRTFGDLAPGSFTVTESATTGWTLEAITCVDPTNNTSVSLLGATATIALDSGENITCTFRNVGPAIVPPQPPQPELPVTGSAIGIPAFLTGAALLGFGLMLSGVSRRRRAA